MSFFKSEVVRSEMAEISELQEEVYANVFKFPTMTKDEKLSHVKMLEKLLNDQPEPMKAFDRMEFDDMKAVLQKWLAPEEEESAISSEPASNFDDEKPKTEETPWQKPAEKFTLEAQGKKVESKADKFDSLFSDDLPF